MASGVKFYADSNFYGLLIDFMRDAGQNCFSTTKEVFPKGNVPDEVWIKHVAKRDMVILSRDLDILVAPIEYEALRTSNAKAILFAQSKRQEGLLEFATWFLRSWPKILQTANAMQPGDVYVASRVAGLRKINPDTYRKKLERRKADNRAKHEDKPQGLGKRGRQQRKAAKSGPDQPNLI